MPPPSVTFPTTSVVFVTLDAGPAPRLARRASSVTFPTAWVVFVTLDGRTGEDGARGGPSGPMGRQRPVRRGARGRPYAQQARRRPGQPPQPPGLRDGGEHADRDEREGEERDACGRGRLAARVP